MSICLSVHTHSRTHKHIHTHTLIANCLTVGQLQPSSSHDLSNKIGLLKKTEWGPTEFLMSTQVLGLHPYSSDPML